MSPEPPSLAHRIFPSQVGPVSGPSIETVAEDILGAGRTIPDGWQVQVQARAQARAAVFLRSSLTDDAARSAHLQPIQDIGALMDRLLAQQPAARVCVLPEGPQTIPFLQASRVGAGGGEG